MNKKLYTLDEDKLILTLRDNNATIDEICNRLHRSKPSVSYRVYRILNKLEKKPDFVPAEKPIPVPIIHLQQIKDEEIENGIEDIIEVAEIEEVEAEENEVTEEVEAVEKKEDFEEAEDNRQHYFKEIYLPPAELDKLTSNLNPKQTDIELHYIEILKVFQGKLISRVFELIESHMTEHQKKIVVLMLKNKTYNNMAILLNINYTAIAHAIKGIKTKKHGKYHGGIERKLRKICMRDDCCLEILKQIASTRQEMLQVMEESSEVLVEGY